MAVDGNAPPILRGLKLGSFIDKKKKRTTNAGGNTLTTARVPTLIWTLKSTDIAIEKELKNRKDYGLSIVANIQLVPLQ
jgi:hypothetical protein